jgi:hypothetical protein
MEDIRELVLDLQRRSDELGVYLKPPLRALELREWRDRLEAHISIEVPEEYVMLLGLSNGVETQKGWIYDADSFLEQNLRCWCCNTMGNSSPTGFVIESIPLAAPSVPEYAWLGAYGNMDMYIFDFQRKQYRATSLGDTNYVWFSTLTLVGLIRYMAEEKCET